jgi:hypothetical protein
MDRDALLVAALGAAVLTGCTPDRQPRPTPSASPSLAPTDPDVATLRAWASAERSIAARYGTLVRTVPSLKPLRANHLARAAAVEERLAFLGAAPPSPPATEALRGKPAALLSAFAAAERRLAARYLADLRALRDPALAVVGAELAAGARQHAVVLGLARP